MSVPSVMNAYRLTPHDAQAVGRRMLHQDAVEAYLSDGLSAEEWLELEGTRSLARAFGVESSLEHIAAYVWRPLRRRSPWQAEPMAPSAVASAERLPFEALEALRTG